MRRGLVIILAVLAVSLGAALAVRLAPGGPIAAAVRSPAPSAPTSMGTSRRPAPTPSPSPMPTRTPASSPTPVPSPTPVAGALDGLPLSPALAARRPIFVMVDDHPNARPQSGFNAASVVWQAPAEGGIARYMLGFQEGDPAAVGPVRSARYYFVGWAAEWDALYVHVGGSPQALEELSAQGAGQLVYNADEFRWGGSAGYLWRIAERSPPHNVYSDGSHLRSLAERLGATADSPAPAWTFGSTQPLASRPLGGTISVPYPWNAISYRYDRASDRYLRFTAGAPQVDAADGRQVAPRNVVILSMAFGPLNDAHPEKGRLEADLVGSGKALVATGGRTVAATWRKASLTAPTLLFGADGQPVVLTAGQTFVQVVPLGTAVTVTPGTVGMAPPRAQAPS